MDGVAAELVESGFAQEAVDKYLALFEATANGRRTAFPIWEKLWRIVMRAWHGPENLSEIVDSVQACHKHDSL